MNGIAKLNEAQKNTSVDFEYSSEKTETLLEQYRTTLHGLTQEEAEQRLQEYGLNEPAKKKKRTILVQILSKFVNPLVIVLLIIAASSMILGGDEGKISALLVSLMALMSVFLSFIQEYRASKEAERLSELVSATSTVYRDGKTCETKIKDLVPGDIVDLFAGDIIPADLRILSCKDLFINQSSLTGESFPVEKFSDPIPNSKTKSISELNNIAYMGSTVVSGTALALVVKTGISTQFGEVSKKLATMRVDTSFDKGIRKFTWLMIRFMLVLIVLIFAINVIYKKNFVEALLFSLAVAVGLTPEMLPMLVAINLSKGAIAMSKKRVIVKRLNSIQNFGAMDVLCTDKTGTLTMDEVVLEKHCDVVRNEDEEVLRVAYANSFYQTGLKNLLDKAILKHQEALVEKYKKIDEIPFDFSRKIMSVVVDVDGKHMLICKGAPEEIFKRCTKYELDGDTSDIGELLLPDLRDEYNRLSADGFRVLAIAYKEIEIHKAAYSKDDEKELVLKGYLAFLDPPKPSTKAALDALKEQGVEVKVLTGDNELVTKKICSEVGLNVKGLITGDKVDPMSDAELQEILKTTTVLARLSPMQKERVIRMLQKNNHTVGYLGDGINDAPALKASDVGISVNNAVDIAKESADIILLEKSLMVLKDGIIEGRKTFGNIVKYIRMSASSNFGNMFSMIGASIMLPFLPMAPIQILLNNFLYDLSQVGIPTDKVDEEYLTGPRPWDIRSIRNFMILFGPISSLFDYATFGVLMYLHAPEKLFQTVWFLESLASQTFIIHIIRTSKTPFIESRASNTLILTSISIVAVGYYLPFSSLARYFEFVRPPNFYFLILLVIVGLYMGMAHVVKKWFVKKYGYG